MNTVLTTKIPAQEFLNLVDGSIKLSKMEEKELTKRTLKSDVLAGKEVYVDNILVYSKFGGLVENPIKAISQRYVLFKENTTCVCCGLTGTYFKESVSHDRQGNFTSSHVNLYGVSGNGKEVLLTKDHIIAASNGGLDLDSNYQTMCNDCNTFKGNKELHTVEELREYILKDLELSALEYKAHIRSLPHSKRPPHWKSKINKKFKVTEKHQELRDRVSDYENRLANC